MWLGIVGWTGVRRVSRRFAPIASAFAVVVFGLLLVPGSALAVRYADGCGDQSLGAGSAGAFVWAKQVQDPSQGVNEGVWTMNADGSNPHAITDPPHGSSDSNADTVVALSPDGSKIAYSCGSDLASSGNVYVAAADGSNALLLGPGDDPTFSPDSRHIAFVNNGNIETVNVYGSGLQQITPNFNCATGWCAAQPAWGPANVIAYRGNAGGDFGIWTLNSDGSSNHEIADAGGGCCQYHKPAWSVDGGKLLFERFSNPPCCPDSWDLYTAPIAATPTNGIYPTSVTSVGNATAPIYSTDGSYIYYVNNSTNSLMQMPSGGGTAVQVGPTGELGNANPVRTAPPSGPRDAFSQPGINPRCTRTDGFSEPSPLGLVEGLCSEVPQPLQNDPLGLSVNAADGNLTVGQQDLSIAGTGMPLTVGLYFNSMAGASGQFGYGWTSNQGGDVRLVAASDGSSETFYGPSGYAMTFTKSGSSYAAPAGLDVTLVQNADSSFTLTVKGSGQVFSFTSAGALTSIADKNGNKISYSYTGGVLSSITDTQGRQVSVASSGGLITGMTDRTGRSVGYGYNSSGDLTSFTDANNGITRYGYDADQRLNQITDPDGNVTNITYVGNSAQVASVTRITNPTAGTGDTTNYSYTMAPTTGPCAGDAAAATITDPNTHASTECFDSQARKILEVDALGNQTAYAYNPDNQPTQITHPSGAVTSYGYDANNNLTSVQEPTGAKTTWQYADASHPFYPTQMTDAQGNVTKYAYDTAGDPNTITDANNKQTILAYNANGTLASATDRSNNKTSYGYDANGNLTSITPPSPLGAVAITPDALSRVGQVKDGKGQTKTFSYDPLNDVTQVQQGTTTIGYQYDHAGNQTQETDPTGTTTFTWDPKDRLSQATFPGNKIVGYGYDGADNLTTLTDPSGTVQYGYDNANRLTSLTDPSSAQTTFGYNANSDRTTTAYPNGVTLTNTYATDSGNHATSRLASIAAKNSGGTTLQSASYSYANGANDTDLRQSVTDASNNKTAYTYDLLNRLTEAKTTTSGGSTTADYKYTYDPVGNMLTAINGAATTTSTYNAANELCWSFSGTSTNACGSPPRKSTTYSYDADGNQTTDSASSLAYAYNGLNQTSSITANHNSALTMAYRGSAQADRSSAGSTSFINGELGTISTTTGTSTTSYTRDPTGNLISERTPTGTYYYIPDGLGSITGLTDTTGALVNTYQYDPYGNTTNSTGTVTNPWRYAGQYQDSTTGLYKMGERYYNPGLGRWSQQDPIVDFAIPGQDDRYAYVAGNPANLVDPSGLCSLACGLDRALDAVGNGLNTAGNAISNADAWLFHTVGEQTLNGIGGCIGLGVPGLEGGPYVGAAACIVGGVGGALGIDVSDAYDQAVK